MTDLDQRLADAGQAWRAQQPPPPEPDLARLARRRWRPIVPVAAFVLAVAVVVATVMLVRSGSDRHSTATTTTSSSTTSSGPSVTGNPGGQSPPVLHDGDTAEASGQVYAPRGKPVQFCPQNPAPSFSSSVAVCRDGVTAVGVDLSQLTDRQDSDGTITGRATLRGVYRAGTLRVTRQGPAAQTVGFPAPDLPAVLRTTPCAAPSGRWTARPYNNTAIGDYLRQHPDRFNGMGTTYPYGRGSAVTVIVVGVVRADQAQLSQALTELRARFGDNICTVRVDRSLPEQQATEHAALQLMHDPANGIFAVGGPIGFRPVDVSIDLLTPERYAKLSQIGLSHLLIQPWLEPVR
jgi:hypothetical protein